MLVVRLNYVVFYNFIRVTLTIPWTCRQFRLVDGVQNTSRRKWNEGRRSSIHRTFDSPIRHSCTIHPGIAENCCPGRLLNTNSGNEPGKNKRLRHSKTDGFPDSAGTFGTFRAYRAEPARGLRWILKFTKINGPFATLKYDNSIVFYFLSLETIPET